MSHPAIRIEGLWKEYVIGGAPAGRTFREMATDSLGAPLRWLRGEAGAREEERFWALRDVSLEIGQGEVVGIIGRNGAGKSTLLKILSRITAPTRGRVEIRGRIASLLEVGTGFHPELTGRENVYLNGSILGMSRAEIRAKFDEIVAFAGVERFIDTPVKRYSSGMQVRLAFAVAAHLDPEILVVDEVLAVGDIEFQQKCLGKMGEIAEAAGKTVLLVSHNMSAIETLCRSVILIEEGRLRTRGNANAVVREYISRNRLGSAEFRHGHIRHRGSTLNISHINFLSNGQQSRFVRSGDECVFEIAFAPTGQISAKNISISIILHLNGQRIANLWTDYCSPLSPTQRVQCIIPKWPFRNGLISIDIYTNIGVEVQDWMEDALQIESHDGPYYGGGPLTNPDQGLVFVDHRWLSPCP